MQILSVTPIKTSASYNSSGSKKPKAPSRYHVRIYLDSKNLELDLPLYASEIYRYEIKEDAQLPDELYTELLDRILRKRIITRCEYLINSKPYTEKELRDKLKEGFYPEPLIDEVIATMLSYHFIDDEDYASRYVELNGTRKSKRIIAMELKAKGISEELIEASTSELEYLQEDVLEKLAHKRCDGKDLSDPKEWNKHFRYFLSKGFNFDEISAILEKLKAE